MAWSSSCDWLEKVLNPDSFKMKIISKKVYINCFLKLYLSHYSLFDKIVLFKLCWHVVISKYLFTSTLIGRLVLWITKCKDYSKKCVLLRTINDTHWHTLKILDIESDVNDRIHEWPGMSDCDLVSSKGWLKCVSSLAFRYLENRLMGLAYCFYFYSTLYGCISSI